LAAAVQQYAVQITNVEPGVPPAFATSGPMSGSANSYRFPFGVPFGSSFDGLCKCEVAIDTGSNNFDYVSAPLYFVFDHVLEKLFDATAITLSWQPGNDPDNKPGSGQRFHVQIASDPLFN